MKSSEIEKRRLTLDDLAHIDEETGVEYWYARDLQRLLGYTKWQNFEEAIQRARTSLETTKTPDEEHFAGVSKMVKLGSGAERKIKGLQTHPLRLLPHRSERRSPQRGNSVRPKLLRPPDA